MAPDCNKSNLHELLRRFMLGVMAGTTVCLSLSFCPTSVYADDVVAKYFDQLRRRHLFSVAETYCLRQLSNPRLPDHLRVALTLELSRTFVKHARNTSGRGQAELWQRAKNVVARFLEENPNDRQALKLEVHGALIPAYQGEFLRWQSELRPFDQRLTKSALASLATAVTRLSPLEKQLTQEVRKTRTKRDPAVVKLFEIKALRDEVRYRLGTVKLNQYRLLPVGSPDRTMAAIEATKWFKHFSESRIASQHAVLSQLALASLSRLQHDLKQANLKLRAVEKAALNHDVAELVVAERARLLLAEGNFPDATELIIDYRRANPYISGELQFLLAESLFGNWKLVEKTRDSNLAGQLMERLSAHVARAMVEPGGYWGERCRLLLETARQSKKFGSELAILVAQATSLYGVGKITESLDAYRRAAASADQSGKFEVAMQLGYTRASILVQQKEFELAADAFSGLVERYPSAKQTASADLLSAYCRGRLYEERRTPSRREAYTQALNRHREKFQNSPTWGEATWMLARFQEQRMQLVPAFDLYSEIALLEHVRVGEAHAGIARCCEWILNRLRKTGKPTSVWEEDAEHRLGTFTSKYPMNGKSLSRHECETMLRFARIRLNRTRPKFGEADGLLRQVFAKWDAVLQTPDRAQYENDSHWKWIMQSATQLRIVSLAGQGRSTEAHSLVRELSQASATEVLGVLDGLMQVAGGVDGKIRRELGELQLQTAESLKKRLADLNMDQRLRLDHCFARAYAATDQPDKAIEVYESLLRKAPRDKTLLRTVAELMIECGSPKCLVGAKSKWKRLETLEKTGTQPFMEARYHVALCCFQLKEYDKCRQLLTVTRILFPKRGNEAIQEKLKKLEADVRRQGKK